MPFTKYRKTKPRRFEKLPPVPPLHNSGCLHCGLMHVELPPDAIIAVGFGPAQVLRDNRLIWFEDPNDDEDPMTCAKIEAIASQDPEHDWRIEYIGPLSEKEYQRQEGKWVLIRTGMGFA